MRIIDSLKKVYDKSYSQFITPCKDCCEIIEIDKNATFHKLEVYDNGASLSMCHTKLIEGQKIITEDMSSILKDSNCDGVVLLYSPLDGGKEHLIFAELKSTYACDKLKKAFTQLIHSLLKYHRLLSLLAGYVLSNITIDFVLACHAPNREQDADYSLDIVAEQECRLGKGKVSFIADLLPKLEVSTSKTISFSLNELSSVSEYPFNLDIMNKTIKMHLITSQTPTDDKARIYFNY